MSGRQGLSGSMFLGVAVGLIATQGAVRADSMSTWQGASASAMAFSANPTTSQGSNASASASGSVDTIIHWSHENYASLSPPLTSGGSVSATATGNSTNLLQINTNLGVPYTGDIYGGVASQPYGIAASASWSNDSVTIHAPQGLALPSDIRLQFSLVFNPQGYATDQQYGTNTLSYNGHTVSLTNTGTGVVTPYAAYNFPFDTLTNNYFLDSSGLHELSGTQTATFHIDLGLSQSGISEPFSLSLQSINAAQLVQDMGTYMTQDMTLSLTGVTTADGTPLQSLGYSVSFASGMAYPVPEPATMAAWGLVSAACGLASLHRA